MDLRISQDLQHEDNTTHHTLERICQAISTKAQKNASFIRVIGREGVKQVSHG